MISIFGLALPNACWFHSSRKEILEKWDEEMGDDGRD